MIFVQLEGEGTELQKEHPVVIVQDVAFAALSTRLCVPMSSSAQPSELHVETVVQGQPTQALAEQARALAVSRLLSGRPAATIPIEDLYDIRAVVTELLYGRSGRAPV